MLHTQVLEEKEISVEANKKNINVTDGASPLM